MLPSLKDKHQYEFVKIYEVFNTNYRKGLVILAQRCFKNSTSENNIIQCKRYSSRFKKRIY